MDIARAWRDPEYRSGLATAELPVHPAGIVELADDQLDSVGGGTSWGCAIATITATLTVCSPSGTACGSCSHSTSGCC